MEKLRKIFGEFWFILFLFPVLNIIIHLLLPEYGLHRDEFYYIAIGDSYNFLNWDMLPVSPLFLKLFTYLFGYSFKAIHLASSVLSGISILFAMLIAKELGGKKYSLILTGSLLLFSLLYAFGSMYIYDDPLITLQMITFFIYVRMIKNEKPKYWLLIGFLIGLGFLTKISIAYFAISLCLSLLFVPRRKYYLNKWFWYGIVLIIIFTLPFLIWQYNHNWYYLDFANGYEGSGKLYSNIFEALWNLIFTFNILNFPVWIAGFIVLLFSKKWKEYRNIGIMFIIYLSIYLFFQAQFYFLAPLLIMLLSAGSVVVEELLDRKIISSVSKRMIKIAIPSVYFVVSIPFLSFMSPLLPVEKYIEYTNGVNFRIKTSSTKVTNLPQHFADRFGWEEFASQISGLYAALPDSIKKDCGIISTSWGDGSALHYYRQKYAYPEPLITVGYHSYLTPEPEQIKSKYLIYGMTQRDLKPLFKKITVLGTFSHPYCVQYRNNMPIMLCEDFKFDMRWYMKINNQMDPAFRKILKSEGITKAKEYFYSERVKNNRIALFTESQLNRAGYNLLSQNKFAEAIEAFKLNVEIFSESFNVYDSLGEAFYKNGDYVLSLINYKKSLELNPDNKNAERMIKEITKKV